MSIPTPPPERQSAYPHQTPAPSPAPPPPVADPTIVYPAALQPAAVQPVPVPGRAGRSTRPPGRPVGRRRTLLGRRRRDRPGGGARRPGRRPDRRPDPRIDLVVQDIFGTGSTGAAYVDRRRVLARARRRAAAPARAHHPEAQAFFGWIMFLATLTAALLPLTWTDVLESVDRRGPRQRAHRHRDLVAAARRAEPHPAPGDDADRLRPLSRPPRPAARWSLDQVGGVQVPDGSATRLIRRAGGASRAGRSRDRTGCR